MGDAVSKALPHIHEHHFLLLDPQQLNISSILNEIPDSLILDQDDVLLFTQHTDQLQYSLEITLGEWAVSHTIQAVELAQRTFSIKYAWDLCDIISYVFSQYQNDPQLHPSAKIHRTAQISGPVIVSEHAEIYEYAVIKRLVYIGSNAMVGSSCKVRDNSVIETSASLPNAVEVARSNLGENSSIHSGYVEDSIL